MLRSLIVATALAVVPLQNAKAPEPPTYDAKFTAADGQVYTGTMTFSVDAKGAVAGKMRLIDPIEVTATLAGTVKGAKWTFEYPYEIPQQGCSGIVKGEADVPADRKVIQGKGVAAGCSDQPLELTFTLTKK